MSDQKQDLSRLDAGPKCPGGMEFSTKKQMDQSHSATKIKNPPHHNNKETHTRHPKKRNLAFSRRLQNMASNRVHTRLHVYTKS